MLFYLLQVVFQDVNVTGTHYCSWQTLERIACAVRAGKRDCPIADSTEVLKALKIWSDCFKQLQSGRQAPNGMAGVHVCLAPATVRMCEWAG